MPTRIDTPNALQPARQSVCRMYAEASKSLVEPKASSPKLKSAFRPEKQEAERESWRQQLEVREDYCTPLLPSSVVVLVVGGSNGGGGVACTAAAAAAAVAEHVFLGLTDSMLYPGRFERTKGLG